MFFPPSSLLFLLLQKAPKKFSVRFLFFLSSSAWLRLNYRPKAVARFTKLAQEINFIWIKIRGRTGCRSIVIKQHFHTTKETFFFFCTIATISYRLTLSRGALLKQPEKSISKYFYFYNAPIMYSRKKVCGKYTKKSENICSGFETAGTKADTTDHVVAQNETKIVFENEQPKSTQPERVSGGKKLHKTTQERWRYRTNTAAARSDVCGVSMWKLWTAFGVGRVFTLSRRVEWKVLLYWWKLFGSTHRWSHRSGVRTPTRNRIVKLYAISFAPPIEPRIFTHSIDKSIERVGRRNFVVFLVTWSERILKARHDDTALSVCETQYVRLDFSTDKHSPRQWRRRSEENIIHSWNLGA